MYLCTCLGVRKFPFRRLLLLRQQRKQGTVWRGMAEKSVDRKIESKVRKEERQIFPFP